MHEGTLEITAFFIEDELIWERLSIRCDLEQETKIEAGYILTIHDLLIYLDIIRSYIDFTFESTEYDYYISLLDQIVSIIDYYDYSSFVYIVYST